MGSPGTGKTTQLVNIARMLEEHDKPLYVIDCEDKLSPMLNSLPSADAPDNIQMRVAYEWNNENENESEGEGTGFKQAVDWLEQVTSPGDWIAVDRMDLAWSFVQRWYAEYKYNEDLAEMLAKRGASMKKSSMFVPSFDGGAWQVIKAQYEWQALKLLYRLRCNVVFTSGIKVVEGDDKSAAANAELFGNLGLLPRGEKEIGHQPLSVFLLTQKRTGQKMSWRITTGKDLPGRDYFDHEKVTDFSVQYVEKYAAL